MKNQSNDKEKKFGLRIYKISRDTILLKQTIKHGNIKNEKYVLDGQKERHVKIGDDSKIAEAVRDGLSGKFEE